MKSLEVTASTPQEMVQSQSKLIAWCGAKITSLAEEKAKIESDLEHARKHKWKIEPFQRMARRLQKSMEFYGKMRSALEHGLCIVPNFPCDVFAVRVAGRPKGKATVGGRFEHAGQSLPEGEGDWVNPFPFTGETTIVEKNRDGTTNTVEATYPHSWDTEIDFPVEMARPHIMDLTTAAMQNKFFDELGFSPERNRLSRGDPMILGRILMPKAGWSARKAISFLIAWHIDTREL